MTEAKFQKTQEEMIERFKVQPSKFYSFLEASNFQRVQESTHHETCECKIRFCHITKEPGYDFPLDNACI